MCGQLLQICFAYICKGYTTAIWPMLSIPYKSMKNLYIQRLTVVVNITYVSVHCSS